MPRRADDPFSDVDKAALAVLTDSANATNDALAELARVIATRDGLQPTQRPKRTYSISRDGNGDLVGTVVDGGRARRFRVGRDGNGDLVGEVEEIDPAAEVTPAPMADGGAVSEAAFEPLGTLADVFGSLDDTPP